jgi:acyl-CoA thioesterase
MDETLKEYFAGDAVAAGMGMRILEAGPGRAVIEMPVDARHLNGMGIAHGASLFALADFCHAVASNAAGRVAVAIHCGISYFKAVQPGAMLIATGTERHAGGAIAEYDISIRDDAGDLVAAMQGMVYRKKDTIAQALEVRREAERKRQG